MFRSATRTTRRFSTLTATRSAASTAVLRRPISPKTLTTPPFSRTHYLHFSTYRAPSNPKASDPLRKLRDGLLAICAALFLFDRVIESSRRKYEHFEQLDEILGRINPLVDELIADVQRNWKKTEEVVGELIEGGEEAFRELVSEWELMRVKVGELEGLIASYDGDEFRVLSNKVRKLMGLVEKVQGSLEERCQLAAESNRGMTDWFEGTENDNGEEV